MAILSSDQVKMTSLLEKIVAIIAPHRCIVCGNYDNILCISCLHDIPRLEVSCCVLCGKPTVDWRVCIACEPRAKLMRIWPFAEYTGITEAVIKRFKFAHARAAADPLAICIDMTLPYLEPGWLVVSIPTAAVRVRQRGYDQAALLAHALAKKRGLAYASVLNRRHNMRQLGASRVARRAQASQMFTAQSVRGKKVLLVDDVCTTGATLQAAAVALKKAGAAEVSATVVAWKI